jgi:D-3-phosphoglycerate dehydrogenase
MNVFRCNISKYQSKDYASRERAVVEKLGFSYFCNSSDSQLLEQHPDILITNSNTELQHFNFDLSKIKLLIHPNSGHDNLAQELVQKLGGPVILGNPIRANAVVNYTLSCFYQAFHLPPFVQQWDSQRQWSRLIDIEILIIGHGHIGKKLHQALCPLYPHIEIYDPYVDSSTLPKLENLSRFDAILLAPALTSTSYHLVDKCFLEQLKSSVVIINGARGKLIKQDDLINFLANNHQARAFIDVFEQEPADLSVWNTLPNVYLTSHVAGVFSTLDDHILQFIQTVLTDFKVMTPHDFLHHYRSLHLQSKLTQIPAFN